MPEKKIRVQKWEGGGEKEKKIEGSLEDTNGVALREINFLK